MVRPRSSGLTPGEQRVMEVLWQLGEATVADVQKALAKKKLAYTTVLTTIRVLEGKGYVRHDASGRAYVYRPAVTRTQMRSAALQNFLSTWFDASPSQLVANLLDERELDSGELEKFLATMKKRGRK